MSNINLGNAISTRDIPSISWETREVLRELDASDLANRVDDFKKSQILYEEKQCNPIKFKVTSLLAAGLIVSIIIGGALTAYYAPSLFHASQDARIVAGLFIVIGTVIVANVVGAYFHYKWHGIDVGMRNIECPPVQWMSFFGIGTPIWRAFTNSLDTSRNQEFAAIRREYNDNIIYKNMMSELNKLPPTSEGIKAKEEIQAIYDFFCKEDPPTAQIELKDLN